MNADVKTALAIRHVTFEDLGAFAPVISAAGFEIDYVDVAEQNLGALESDAMDLLVILGGPIGAYEETVYPFLKHELVLIERQLVAGRPLMGICLGAQLIARAVGERVFPSSSKEIGFDRISLTESGVKSCLMPFAEEPITLHWHGDSFDLPRNAVRLASTERCENQAFSIGPNVIGFQFHPEADGHGIEKWLVGHAVELAAAAVDIRRVRADAQVHGVQLAKKAHQVAAAWIDQIQM